MDHAANAPATPAPPADESAPVLKAQVTRLLSALQLAQRAHELQDARIAMLLRTQDQQRGTVAELRRQLQRAEGFIQRSQAPQRLRLQREKNKKKKKKSRRAREGRWCLFGCDAGSGDDDA